MNHRFYGGEIFHKRFLPRIHHFTYDYFFLDIDVNDLEGLNIPLFRYNRLGMFSFFAKDHFGRTDDFLRNVYDGIERLEWENPSKIRFLTLPRIFHFVFNPISVLLLLDSEGNATHMIAEVHNYNGGRVLYPMILTKIDQHRYRGEHPKSMYVSPFMGYEGLYSFTLDYTEEYFGLRIELFEEKKEMLVAHFSGSSLHFSSQSIRTLLCRHTFLTLFVVTRTLWQSFRLKLKNIPWYSPRSEDHIKKEIA